MHSYIVYLTTRTIADILKMANRRLLYLLCITWLLLLWNCSGDRDKRPADTLLIDKAELLGTISETLDTRLSLLRSDYGVEVVLASLKEVPEGETITELAARLFSQWDIGRNYGGRGLLLLLADREKEVRLEVGMNLEAIFTDLFTGHIEHKQLKSYFLSGQLEVGLIAVLEEIEARAALTSLQDDLPARIEALDTAFLSAGGGADVALKEYERSTTGIAAQSSYPAGSSPDEAWQTLLKSWRERNRSADIGVYTPVTRLIYRDFVNQPESRFAEDIRTWGGKPYEVIDNGDYTVIFFGNKKGWENAPFLFCRTEEGWQFDMVHQRKLVRMGKAPLWGIERGEHPYIELLSNCPYWMGQDIPFPDEDIYRVQDDAETARKIIQLETRLDDNGEDFETLYELGRLYTLTSMGQKRFTLLGKALKLKPDHPDTLKNLAIAHVDAHYQYNKAASLMTLYVRRRPSDPFGHFFLGYLQLMNKRYDEAITSLDEGLKLAPDNIYGLCKLARSYLARARDKDRAHAEELLLQAEAAVPGHIRVAWLRRLLTETR